MPSVPEPDNPLLRCLIKLSNRSASCGQSITVIVDLPCDIGQRVTEFQRNSVTADALMCQNRWSAWRQNKQWDLNPAVISAAESLDSRTGSKALPVINAKNSFDSRGRVPWQRVIATPEGCTLPPTVGLRRLQRARRVSARTLRGWWLVRALHAPADFLVDQASASCLPSGWAS